MRVALCLAKPDKSALRLLLEVFVRLACRVAADALIALRALAVIAGRVALVAGIIVGVDLGVVFLEAGGGALARISDFVDDLEVLGLHWILVVFFTGQAGVRGSILAGSAAFIALEADKLLSRRNGVIVHVAGELAPPNLGIDIHLLEILVHGFIIAGRAPEYIIRIEASVAVCFRLAFGAVKFVDRIPVTAGTRANS